MIIALNLQSSAGSCIYVMERADVTMQPGIMDQNTPDAAELLVL